VSAPRAATTLFRNGPIYPMTGAPLSRGAVMVRGNEITYVGPEDGLDATDIRRAEEIDLEGRPLLPGFCDGHVHLVLAARRFAVLDLRGCDDLAELQTRVRRKTVATPPGAWVIGHGWERHRILEGQRPSLAFLDEAARNHPVMLTSKDLHSAWFNTAGFDAVLRLGSLPPQSVVQREAGAPTGLVIEGIFDLEQRLLHPTQEAARPGEMAPFMRHLLRCGVTAVHSNETPVELGIVRRALQHPGPGVRVLHNLVFDSPDALRAGAQTFRVGIPDWLCTGGVKLFLDGSFGTLTAGVTNPYAGTEDRGLLTMDPDTLDGWLTAAAEIGAPAVMHAIGDRAIEMALVGLSRQIRPPGIRHRLEHAQLLSESILENHNLGGLVFSSQPSHMISDRQIVQRHMTDPNGRRWAYAHRTMLERGGVLVFGSDAPVENVDPWKGIHAAVTRLESTTAPPWIAEERIAIKDALAAHTCWPAQLHAHGFATGTITPGKLADLVVLSHDPFALDPADWGVLRDGISVEQTWLDGELVHTAV